LIEDHSEAPPAPGIRAPAASFSARARWPVLALAAAGVAAAGVAAAGVAASCRSVEGTRGVPPWFEIYPRPSRETIDALEPRAVPEPSASLVAPARRPRPGAYEETYFRPLGSFEELGVDAWRLVLLKPFAQYRSSPHRTDARVLPFWLFRRRPLPVGGDDVDWMLFPLLFGGSDPIEGAYFAVFPFGGRLKGLFGHQVIDFALFPLWARAVHTGRESWSWLWPVFNTVSGSGWSGFRVWPFYTRYAHDDADGSPRRRQRAILWPFWTQDDVWQEGERTQRWFLFPFYGERRNARSVTRTYAWPLVVTYHDRKRDERLVGGAFFPFRFGEHDDNHYFDPWPFFGVKGRDSDAGTLDASRIERFRQFAVWPFQRYDWTRDSREESSRFWFLPFWWMYSTVDRASGESSRKWKVWPLVGYERDRDDARLDVFSPLWFHREDWYRTYGRLFALFRARATARYTGFELLWGTLYWGHGDPLADRPRAPDVVDANANEDFLFSVLGGLFECGRVHDKLALRLLWIPWW